VTRIGIVWLLMMMTLMSAGHAEDAPIKQPVIIEMAEDGTIVVNMRRTADGINVSGIVGINVSGIVKYRVDAPHYKEVLDHRGGKHPGETRPVPAWDDPAPQAK
jgi:hypothetical protein